MREDQCIPVCSEIRNGTEDKGHTRPGSGSKDCPAPREAAACAAPAAAIVKDHLDSAPALACGSLSFRCESYCLFLVWNPVASVTALSFPLLAGL